MSNIREGHSSMSTLAPVGGRSMVPFPPKETRACCVFWGKQQAAISLLLLCNQLQLCQITLSGATLTFEFRVTLWQVHVAAGRSEQDAPTGGAFQGNIAAGRRSDWKWLQSD